MTYFQVVCFLVYSLCLLMSYEQIENSLSITTKWHFSITYTWILSMLHVNKSVLMVHNNPRKEAKLHSLSVNHAKHRLLPRVKYRSSRPFKYDVIALPAAYVMNDARIIPRATINPSLLVNSFHTHTHSWHPYENFPVKQTQFCWILVTEEILNAYEK